MFDTARRLCSLSTVESVLAQIPRSTSLPVAEEAGYRVEIDGCRPYALTRRDMLRLIRSPKIVQRLVYSLRHDSQRGRWLEAFREGRPGTELLVTTASFENAIARLSRGETPDLLPSERRRAENAPTRDNALSRTQQPNPGKPHD